MPVDITLRCRVIVQDLHITYVIRFLSLKVYDHMPCGSEGIM